MLVIRVCVARLIVLFESIDNGENCISFSYILLLSAINLIITVCYVYYLLFMSCYAL